MKYDLICVVDNQRSGFFDNDIIKETLGNKLLFVSPLRFSNKESNVELSIPDDAKKVLLVGRVMDCPNDFIMNMTFAVDAVKRQGAEVHMFIPCLPYARQDRRNGKDVSITSQVMLRMFEQAGVEKLYVVDLHSTQMEGFAKFPIINIDSMPILIESIKQRMHRLDGNYIKNWCIVSPDVGGVKRAKKYADALGLPMAIIHKSRDTYTNESTSFAVVGDVNNKHCVVVDDMVDTGGTLIDANKMLRNEGAKSVLFTIGHGVLSNPRKELQDLDLIVLNTCPWISHEYFTIKTVEEYFLNLIGFKLFEKGFGR
jgi:ribose-phosphate pyrophosphokinase